MLIRFSVENFKSFNSCATWSAIADSSITTHSYKVKKVGNIEVLSNIAVYGPNGSGKTSLISSIKFIKDWLKNDKGLSLDSSRQYCRINEENESKPTQFIMQFSSGEYIYTYHISVKLSTLCVLNEILYVRKVEEKQSTLLFERKSSENVFIGDGYKNSLTEKEITRWEVYHNDFNENEKRDSLLFLGHFVKGKKIGESENLKYLWEAYNYITHQIAIIRPEDVYMDGGAPYEIVKNEDFVNFLARFDTGITGLRVVETELDAKHMDLSERLLEYFKEEMEKSRIGDKTDAKFVVRSRKEILIFEFDANDSIICKTIKTSHEGTLSLFDFKEESDGTRRLFDLMGILLSPKMDKVYIVDEIDRSMHSQLTAAFIRSFNQINKNKYCQLFFTTHDTTLLDDETLLRKDEVYFVERNHENATKLYSLSDFHVWEKSTIAEAYRQGRYGALPLINLRESTNLD